MASDVPLMSMPTGHNGPALRPPLPVLTEQYPSAPGSTVGPPPVLSSFMHSTISAGAKSTTKKKIVPGSKSWLKVDAEGVATMLHADKYRLTHKLGVQTRDLRVMDPNLATTYPSAILCREKALVVNLEHIKAIITRSYVLIMNPDEELVVPFITELKLKLTTPQSTYVSSSFAVLPDPEGKLQGYNIPGFNPPFELKALEICLESISSYYDRLVSDLEAVAYPALDALTSKVSSGNLEHVRRVKNRLVRLTTRVETVREVLEKFLNDDEDMHDMNLTAKEQDRLEQLREKEQSLVGTPRSRRSSRSSSDSEEEEEEIAEVEMILEAYFMHLDNTYNRLQTLNEYIQDTEDLVNLKLDQHRNQLIAIDLLLTGFMTSMAVITAVAGIFGQNLNSGLEETPGTFVQVTVSACVGGVILFASFVVFLWYYKLLVY